MARPGHYAYPTVSYAPVIEGFGTVVDVRFFVSDIPSGHTLVSPMDLETLVQHFPFDPEADGWWVADPRVFDLVAGETSGDVAAAFAQALATCDSGADPDWTAAADGANAVRAYRGLDPLDPAQMGCGTIGISYAETSVLLGLDATVVYAEPIVLALPDQATTSTTSPTDPSTPPAGPTATPAAPITAAATFAG